MKPPPAFQFYPGDWLAGTIHMTDEERGLYINLLCVQWETGHILDDNSEITRYSRGNTNLEASIATVRRKFEVCVDGKLRNRRMEEVRKSLAKFRTSCSRAGKNGGGNPSFKEGKPNPYYKGGHKGIDKGQDKGSHKGGDKGKINSSVFSLQSSSSEEDNTPTPLPESLVDEVASLLRWAGKFYEKPANEFATYEEQRLAAELVSTRPNLDADREEISKHWNRLSGEDVRFFPQSRVRLLSAWQEILDKARMTNSKKRGKIAV